MKTLPADRTYVLAYYCGGNWIDSDDQQGCEWVVVKFVRGISLDDRVAMDDCDRKHIWRSEDEGGNNKRPYCRASHGRNKFFGQDIDLWMPLPE